MGTVGLDTLTLPFPLQGSLSWASFAIPAFQTLLPPCMPLPRSPRGVVCAGELPVGGGRGQRRSPGAWELWTRKSTHLHASTPRRKSRRSPFLFRPRAFSSFIFHSFSRRFPSRNHSQVPFHLFLLLTRTFGLEGGGDVMPPALSSFFPMQIPRITPFLLCFPFLFMPDHHSSRVLSHALPLPMMSSLPCSPL